jgi:hypothetical protein
MTLRRPLLAALFALVAGCGEEASAPPDAAPDAGGPDAGPIGPVPVMIVPGVLPVRLVARTGTIYFQDRAPDFHLQRGTILGDAPVTLLADGNPIVTGDFVVTRHALHYTGERASDRREVIRSVPLGLTSSTSQEGPEIYPSFSSFHQQRLSSLDDDVVYLGRDENTNPVLRMLSNSFFDVTDRIPVEQQLRFAGDAINVYWVQRTPGQSTFQIMLASHRFEGPALVPITGQLAVDQLAVDQSHLYWASSALGYIRRASKDGLGVTELAVNQGRIMAMVADAGELYYPVADGPARDDFDDPSDDPSTLYRLRPGSSERELIATGVTPVFAIDNHDVYFVSLGDGPHPRGILALKR